MKPKCPRMTVSGWGLTCNTSQPNLTFHWKSIGKYEQMWGFFLPTGWFLYYALPFSSLRGSFQHTYKVHLPSSFNGLIFPCHSVPFSSQQLVLPSYFSVCCQVESLLHGAGGCTASFQEGTQPKLNWCKDPDVQSAKYLELLCHFGDLIDDVSKGVEKDFDPRVTILQN